MAEETEAPSADELVEILTAPTPYSIQQLRSEDTARRMYPKTTGMESVIENGAFDGSAMPAEKRTAAVSELRNILVDTGLSPLDAGVLVSRAAAVRADGKTAEEARKESRQQLVRMFPTPDAKNPTKGADMAMADAGKLLNRDPRLAKYVLRQGLGNDAATIQILAHAAMSQRTKGKLK